MLTSLCTPALIYLVFMLSHVIATFNDEYKNAIMQFILGLLMTGLLHFIVKGMSIISWIIVFIPFIFYTYMIIIIYYVFGIDPQKVENNNEEHEEEKDEEKDEDVEEEKDDEKDEDVEEEKDEDGGEEKDDGKDDDEKEEEKESEATEGFVYEYYNIMK